jgi:hypothetical protein
VRSATTFDEDEQPPIPYNDQVQVQISDQAQVQANLPKKKKKVQKTKEAGLGPRAATPTALGESIRQHTSNAKPAAVKVGKGKGKEVDGEGSPKKGSKLVIKNTREQRYSDKRAIEEDITRGSLNACFRGMLMDSYQGGQACSTTQDQGDYCSCCICSGWYVYLFRSLLSADIQSNPSEPPSLRVQSSPNPAKLPPSSNHPSTLQETPSSLQQVSRRTKR